MISHSIRDEIVEVVNKLFVYTDQQDWDKLQAEVFTHEVRFDMSSVGGVNDELMSVDICKLWEDGFAGIDSINHLAGNFIVKIQDTTASVFAYATATHYKQSATKGKTREFVGTYDIGLLRQIMGWRIYSFRYDLKYSTGNLSLE
jgi:hypothetical protein